MIILMFFFLTIAVLSLILKVAVKTSVAMASLLFSIFKGAAALMLVCFILAILGV